MSNSVIEQFYRTEDIYLHDSVKYEDKGKRIGVKKGKEKAKREIAKNLLKENVDISLIQKVTNLSKEEIKKIDVNVNTPNILKFKEDSKYWYEEILLEKESKEKSRKEGEMEAKVQIIRKLYEEGENVSFMQKVMNIPRKEVIELIFCFFARYCD